MKVFGYWLIGVGVFYLLIAFNMDVSVSTPSSYVPGYGSIGGGNVANLDLMARRQNHLLVAALITLIGALMAIFGNGRSEPASVHVPTSGDQDEITGEPNLSSDAYRLWLARRYRIERNEVFNRFVVDQQTFDDLDAALIHVHALEMQKIADVKAEDERVDAEVAANKEAFRIAAEEADAQWNESMPKVIVAIFIAISMLFGANLLLGDSTTSSKSSDISTSQVGVKPSEVTSKPKTSPRVRLIPAIDPSNLVTTDGLMGIVVGQSWESVSSRFDKVGGSGSDDPSICEIYESINQRVSAMVESGTVTRIETSNRMFRTPSNVGVGSNLSDLKKAYGSRLVAEDNPYDGIDYFVYAKNGNGIKFGVNSDIVTDLTVGGGSIRYVEGCS